MISPPDEVVAPDLLDFIHVDPPRVRVYPPETHLPWTTLAGLTDSVRRFLDPVLEKDAPLVWSPNDWTWAAA